MRLYDTHKVYTEVKMTLPTFVFRGIARSKTDANLSSIATLKEGEKMLLRPLPLHVEWLARMHRDRQAVAARDVEQMVGESIVRILNDRLHGDSCAPLWYCRQCDAVCDTVDAFYTHIQSQAHTDQKKNDSLPIFAPLAEGEEPLTMHQAIAREFLGVALLAKEGEEDKIEDDALCTVDARLLVQHRLKSHPCAHCTSIWVEYGSIVETVPDAAIEFAFRSHPLHPGVALLNMVLELFKSKLAIDSDWAVRQCPSRSIKFPSSEFLKDLADELYLKITVPVGKSLRHSAACSEDFQVAMHCRPAEVRLIYAKFTEACEKRAQEGRLFFCDVCRLSLPSHHCFLLHLLSESHDKKMLKAPSRQSELYIPLCQMVCFIDATRILPRRREEKKEEKKEEKEEDSDDVKEKKSKSSMRREKRKKEEEKSDEVEEEGKENKEETVKNVDDVTVIHPSPLMIDNRGFVVRRPGYYKQKQMKVVKIMRGIEAETSKEIKVIEI